MQTAVDLLHEMEAQVRELRDNREDVHPGMPAAFTTASTPGDRICQGDLNTTVVDAVPPGYIRVVAPTEADLQLVPGPTTQGSDHRLDSFDGVELWRPSEWSPTYEGLRGPCLVLARERRILHKVHGTVTIAAGLTVVCTYQRVWDEEQRRARRSAD